MSLADDTDPIRRFAAFYRDDYCDELERFAERYPDDQRTLYIDWSDLEGYDPELAGEVIADPERLFERATEALRRYGPLDDLRDASVIVDRIGDPTPPTEFRSRHLGTLVEVTGRVIEASSVTSVLSEGAWECERCGTVTRVSCTPRPGQETPPHECPGCDREGPFGLDHDESEWADHHSFVVEYDPPDDTPETVVVEVFGDASEAIAAGRYVRITGVLRREAIDDHNESSVPDKYVQAYAARVGETPVMNRSSEEERRILELSNDPDLFERLIDSVAPSILGYREEKFAVLLQLFGGVPKELPDGSRIGGEIHTLLVGDPGTAKSALGDAARRLSPDGRRLSGTGGDTLAVGAADADGSVDSTTNRSWRPETDETDVPAPELLFVDDIGELSNSTREALVDVLRGKGVANTGSDTAFGAGPGVLGVAAPRYGRFDAYEPIGTQFDLEPALLSQFDLVFTVTDGPDETADEDLADHILETNYAGELLTHHSKFRVSHISQDEVDSTVDAVAPAIEPDLLRTYVAFARQHCYPTLTEEAKAAIREFYVSLRQQGISDDAPVPVTARKIESLVTLAEASARVRLADTVTAEDAERVIELVRSSLLDVGIDAETGEFDADIVEVGLSKTQRDTIRNVKGIVRELVNETEGDAPLDAIIDWAERVGMERPQVEEAIQRLEERGEVHETSDAHFRVV